MSIKQWERAMRLGNAGAPMSVISYPGYRDDRDAHTAGSLAGCHFGSMERELEYDRLSRPRREKDAAYWEGQFAGEAFRRAEWIAATPAEIEEWIK